MGRDKSQTVKIILCLTARTRRRVYIRDSYSATPLDSRFRFERYTRGQSLVPYVSRVTTSTKSREKRNSLFVFFFFRKNIFVEPDARVKRNERAAPLSVSSPRRSSASRPCETNRAVHADDGTATADAGFTARCSRTLVVHWEI